MKTLFKTFFILLMTTSYAAPTTSVEEALLKQISKGFSTVAKRATPAVVYIESTGTETQKIPQNRNPSENPFDRFNDDFFNRFFGFPFQQQQPQRRQKELVKGSGFIITDDGYIVTNNHVVSGSSKVNVSFTNGRKTTATVVGTDPKTDLALIKVEEKGLPYLTFADSDALEVGDWAIAIGNPFGLQATVTVGVISAKGRSDLHIADFEDFIQTDAAINPGNSGGPLLDYGGKVIGVNTAIVSGSGGYMGIGFAIPSNMVKQIVEQLLKDGEVTRGYLGVTLQAVDADLAAFYKLKNGHGALVTDVIKGSPAEIGGLKQEDIILSYNGIHVDQLTSFRNAVSLMAPGTKLRLRIWRDGEEKELNFVISSLPEQVMGPGSPIQKLGLKVENLTPELAQKLNYVETNGVIITEVEPGSSAAEASLRPGSLILAVNRQRVGNTDDFIKRVHEAMNEDVVLLMVRQGEVVRIVALRF